MVDLTEYGQISRNLDELVERVQSLSPQVWVNRGDPESYETLAIRSNNPVWKDLEPHIQQVLDSSIEYLGPGYFNRVVLSMIPAGKGILPHTDDFGEEVRKLSIHCHVPLITHTDIKMGFGEEGQEREYHLRKGYLYSMDETIRHYVVNPSDVDRVHLLFAHFKH